jgi:predicted nucleotidyltransferase component of viral defense system
MNERLKQMLQRYSLHSQDDAIHAVKEIMQEIALLGLWRSKFFEKAAFYGGTALRILYGLDRFSEALDFSLLAPQPDLNLSPYYHAIQNELESFGLLTQVEPKIKKEQGNIRSAFIKAGTQQQLLTIKVPQGIGQSIHKGALIKIKIEVDMDPPGDFFTESKTLLQPIPFHILTFQLPDLFAGKLHAIICRAWKTRVKGRDWYDMVWFVTQNVPVRLAHLRQRLIQSQHWDKTTDFTRDNLLELLRGRIAQVDFNAARQDILPFIHDPDRIALWSEDFFSQLISQIEYCE